MRLSHHRARGLRRPDAGPRQRAASPAPRSIWIKRKGVGAGRGRARRRHRARPRGRRGARGRPTTTSSRSCTPRSTAPGRTWRRHPRPSALRHRTAAATDAQLAVPDPRRGPVRDGLGVYDEGPELVTGPQPGRTVAAALGARRAALLRNHGVVIAGEDVRWAVLTAVTLERADPLPVDRLHARAAPADLPRVRPSDAPAAEVPGPLPRRLLGGMGAAGAPGRRARRGRPGGDAHRAAPERTRGTRAEIEPQDLLLDVAARAARPDRRQALLRRPGMRHVHRPRRRPAGERLHVPRGRDRRAGRPDHRGPPRSCRPIEPIDGCVRAPRGASSAGSARPRWR